MQDFPQETDEDFDETMNTVKEIGFTHIHAFPYSIREGTPAATMPNQVPEAVKKTRVALLNGLSQSGYDMRTQHLALVSLVRSSSKRKRMDTIWA